MSAIRPHGHHHHRFSLAFALAVQRWAAVTDTSAVRPAHLARWLNGFCHAPWIMKRVLPQHLQEGRFFWLKTRLWLPQHAAAAFLNQTTAQRS